jgi:hypothetical protein
MTLVSLTAAALFLTVEGSGYLRFTLDGRTVYTKSANLTVLNGRLAHNSGAPLAPTVTIGAAEPVAIAADGTVRAAGRAVGRIVLAEFDTEPVRRTDHGFLVFSARPRIGLPGTNGFGFLRSDPPATTHRTVATEAGSTGPDHSRADLIRFAAESSVETDEFTIGQLADATGPLRSVVLGKTPPLGVPRILDRAYIEAKIRQAGFDPSIVRLQAPSRVTVRRAGQSVDHGAFLAAAMAAVADRGAFEPVGPNSAPPMSVPKGRLELVAESVSVSGNEATVTVAAVVAGERFNARTVKLRSTGPRSGLKAGQTATVTVKAGSVFVAAKGRILSLDKTTGLVTVRIEATGATLTGTTAPDGTVEVRP